MKTLSLLWILSIGMFLFSCGGSEDSTETDEVITAEIADHECCAEECADDCEIHAEEKKTCQKMCNQFGCDKSNCDMSQCEKLDCNKSQCDMKKCDGSTCTEPCEMNDSEEGNAVAEEETSA